jgi:hypothetical protein
MPHLSAARADGLDPFEPDGVEVIVFPQVITSSRQVVRPLVVSTSQPSGPLDDPAEAHVAPGNVVAAGNELPR